MSGIVPPPFFQNRKRWGDRRDREAEDRFYEEFGFDTGYRLRRFAQRLAAFFALLRSIPRRLQRRRSKRRLTNCPGGS